MSVITLRAVARERREQAQAEASFPPAVVGA
jgi:hypothetical protein